MTIRFTKIILGGKKTNIVYLRKRLNIRYV